MAPVKALFFKVLLLYRLKKARACSTQKRSDFDRANNKLVEQVRDRLYLQGSFNFIKARYRLTYQTLSSLFHRQVNVDVVNADGQNMGAYRGVSGRTEIGTWWDNLSRPNNLMIDYLFIIDKALEFSFPRGELRRRQQLCFARRMSILNDIP